MKTVTYSCDNPACAEFAESIVAWWQLGIVRPGEDSGWLGIPKTKVMCCSEQCMWEALRSELNP